MEVSVDKLDVQAVVEVVQNPWIAHELVGVVVAVKFGVTGQDR